MTQTFLSCLCLMSTSCLPLSSTSLSRSVEKNATRCAFIKIQVCWYFYFWYLCTHLSCFQSVDPATDKPTYRKDKLFVPIVHNVSLLVTTLWDTKQGLKKRGPSELANQLQHNRKMLLTPFSDFPLLVREGRRDRKVTEESSQRKAI